MQRLSNFKANALRILGGVAACALLLGVACGAAATPSAPTKTLQPAAGQPAAPGGATRAIPAPTATPAVVVHSGKLTWMTGGWGNERFTHNLAVGGSKNYTRILHGFLIATNEKTELLPGLATKWELSPDSKTWTFTIRDGAKFHDGMDITVEDVWWSWMHYWGTDASGSSLDRGVSGQVLARNVQKIEVTARNQVSITTKAPDPGFSRFVSEAGPHSYGVLPRRPKVHDIALEAAYDKNPISAGPGKLLKQVPADLMAFERYDDYYYQPKNGLPEDRRLKFKSLDLRLVPEEATRVAAIRAGEADIAPVSLATRKQVEAGGGRLVFGAEGTYISVRLLGCFKPQYPCHDKRVRHALDLAIDKTVIRDHLFGGPEVFHAKGWSFVTPSSIGYSPDLDAWPQDVAKAQKLLAEAGYPQGKGFGKLVINTWKSASTPFLPEMAQLAADFWRRELGLDVEVKVGDEAVLKKARSGDQLYGQLTWEDNEARIEGVANYVQGYGTPEAVYRFHDDPALFELVNQTRAIVDPVKSTEAFKKLHLRAREETYELGIGYVNIPWGVGPRVSAWQPWPLAFYPSNLHGIVLKSP